MKRFVWLSTALAMVGVVGYVDFVTGPDIGFVLFYLLPIVVTAWWWSLAPALGIAFVAGVVRFLAAFAGTSDDMLSVVVWNSVSRLAIFSAVAYMVARLRRDRARLTVLLSRETELARTDPLTCLPNWRGFEEHLRREISRSRRSAQPLCIGYVDLDNFKRVNDLTGHGAGDECLRRLGAVIREALRPEDIVARVGGDEFAVLFSSPDPVAAETVGRRLIERIRSIGEKYPGADLGASVGVVCYDLPPDLPDALVRQADEVMYQAKRSGKRILVLEIKRTGEMQWQPKKAPRIRNVRGNVVT